MDAVGDGVALSRGGEAVVPLVQIEAQADRLILRDRHLKRGKVEGRAK